MSPGVRETIASPASPVTSAGVEEDDEHFFEILDRRLAVLDAAMGRVVELATAAQCLAAATDVGGSPSPYAEDLRPLVREAVLDLHDAWVDLQRRLVPPDWEWDDPRPIARKAYEWAGRVVCEVLDRAGYEIWSRFVPDGRFIYKYAPPKAPSFEDLLALMEEGPGDEISNRASGAPREREIELTGKDVALLRGAVSLLRADRSAPPRPIAPAPTREQVFPAGWPEEDRDKARDLLRLGRVWKAAVHRRGPVSPATRRAHEELMAAADYFPTFLLRYHGLPRVAPESPFAPEAARLRSSLQGLEDALGGWAGPGRLWAEPAQPAWNSLDRLADAVMEVDEAILAYRSGGPEEAPGPALPTPSWDANHRTLSFNGSTCKVFRGNAASQIRLMEAFQKAGWPREVANPFRERDTLETTIKNLARLLPRESMVRFRISDGRPQWYRPAQDSSARVVGRRGPLPPDSAEPPRAPGR